MKQKLRSRHYAEYKLVDMDVLLPDYEAQSQGLNRFLGRVGTYPWPVNGLSFKIEVNQTTQKPLRQEYQEALKNEIIKEI